MKMINTKALFGAAAFAVGLAVLAPAPAVADLQEEREQHMKNVVGGLKKLVPIIKGEASFDGDMVAEQGRIINENFEAASGKFPEGSQAGRALPVIWEQKAAFDEIMQDAIAASAAVAAAGEANDEAAFKQAFQDMGGTCKSCHEDYRKPE